METTTNWITQLMEEVPQFDSAMFPPAGKVEKGDKVLADCPEIARPYFALAQYYDRECQRMRLEQKYQPGDMSVEDTRRFRAMSQKNDTLMEIFWGLVYDGLNAWEHTVGIREGWVVVICKPKNNPLNVLGTILGVET